MKVVVTYRASLTRSSDLLLALERPTFLYPFLMQDFGLPWEKKRGEGVSGRGWSLVWDIEIEAKRQSAQRRRRKEGWLHNV